MEMVLPASYAVIEEEEMMYLEGGGSVSLYISSRAMQKILTVGAGAATGMLAAALSSNAYAGIIVGAMVALYVDYTFNNI